MLKTFNRNIAMLLVVAMASFLFPVVSFAKSDTAATITYSVDADEECNFKEKDFNNVCKDVNGEHLKYVKFTDLPASSEGKLYYKYDKSGQEKVAESERYYYDKSPSLDDITFVPKGDYSGTVTISYTGQDEEGNTYSGKVKITVDSEDKGVITYKTDADDEVDFDKSDFKSVCKDSNGEKLSYIKITDLPKSSAGKLYYKYDKKGEDKVQESEKYYYDESPSISDITFVPDKDYSGTVTIDYKGYDTSGDTFSGEIKIVVGEGDGSGKMKFSIADNETITFKEKDFNDVCEDANSEVLDYVVFTNPTSSRGTLYYDYKQDSSLTVVNSNNRYYYNNKSPYLSKITFVPAKNVLGTHTLDYKGYDEDGDSFSGSIEITVTAGKDSAQAISYTVAQSAKLAFSTADFNRVCESLTGYKLNYVEFTLPSSSNGTLYSGYVSDSNYSSKVREEIKYYYTGTPSLQDISFVSAKNMTGTITIDYKGYCITGTSYTGKIQISITSGTTGGSTVIDYSKLPVSKYFSDVDQAYSWAVPFVDGLYEAGIISGTNASSSKKLYGPGQNTTRGDFVFILYKALKMQKNTASGSFADVPSSSYYYDAIATAKALGIATGSDNKFDPNSPITREDAMVLVLRAVNITGTTIASGETSSLSNYKDGSKVSDYARTAVAALIKAGIITGSDDNYIYPQGKLTRVQVAAIISRIKK